MPDVIDGQTTDQSQQASSDWRTYLSDDLKADPVVSGWAEKATEKDIPTLIKGYAHAQKRMGSAINLPGQNAKPEELQALRDKLYQAGVFKAPPAKPEDYGLAKPEGLPPGVNWSDEMAGKMAQALHKHGVPKEAIADLMPLYFASLGQQAQLSKATQEEGMQALKTEFGDKFEQHLEMGKRIYDSIFKSPEEAQMYESLGLGNDHRFLAPLLRLAKLGEQDSSFIESLGQAPGAMDGDAARKEYAEIVSNDKHPMHAGLMRRDPVVEKYIDDLYRKAYGTQEVKY